MIIVTGKGHAGTSMIAGLLKANGVFMGDPLNRTLDYLGLDGRHGKHLGGYLEACRAYGKTVRFDKRWWVFSDTQPSPRIRAQIEQYTRPIREHGPRSGYKCPESTLMLPWLVKLYPGATFIHIKRDYAGNTRMPHATDDLKANGVPGPSNPLASWVYHREIVDKMTKPDYWIEVDYGAMCENPAYWVQWINGQMQEHDPYLRYDPVVYEIKRRH